jgi:hypothetical protein
MLLLLRDSSWKLLRDTRAEYCMASRLPSATNPHQAAMDTNCRVSLGVENLSHPREDLERRFVAGRTAR